MVQVQLRRLVCSAIVGVMAISNVGAFEPRVSTSASVSVSTNAALIKAMEQRLNPAQALAEINAWRALHNLASLRLNPQLMTAAAHHSKDMSHRGMISHRGLDGSRLVDRLERVNYIPGSAAENVSAGQRSTTGAIDAWKKSPAHNRALLSDNVSEIGIGMVFAPDTKYRTYWTLVLADAF